MAANDELWLQIDNAVASRWETLSGSQRLSLLREAARIEGRENAGEDVADALRSLLAEVQQ